MNSPVVSIGLGATVQEAAALMLEHRMGAVVVTDEDGAYAGLITERMLLPEEVLVPFMRGSAFKVLGVEVGDFENVEETMAEVRLLRAGDVMATDSPTATMDTHISEIAETMARDGIHHITVLRDKKPVGMVSRHDLLRLFLDPPADD